MQGKQDAAGLTLLEKRFSVCVNVMKDPDGLLHPMV